MWILIKPDLFLHSQQTKLPQPCRRAACRTLKAAELFARLEKPLHLQQVFKCSRVEFLPQTAVALLLLTYVMLQFVFFFPCLALCHPVILTIAPIIFFCFQPSICCFLCHCRAVTARTHSGRFIITEVSLALSFKSQKNGCRFQNVCEHWGALNRGFGWSWLHRVWGSGHGGGEGGDIDLLNAAWGGRCCVPSPSPREIIGEH